MTNTPKYQSTPIGLIDAPVGMIASYRRSPVTIAADRSTSMAGAKIDGLNDGVALLIEELKANPIALETVSLDIISFGGNVDSTGFTPIGDVKPVRYVAGGDTPCGAALARCADDLQSFAKIGSAEQKGDYLAHIWLLSDGAPTDTWMATADRLRMLEHVGMLNAIAIGTDADVGVLAQIVGGKGQVLCLSDVSQASLKALFVWVSRVTTATTNSRRTGAAAPAIPYPSGLIPVV